jgi:protein gp37
MTTASATLPALRRGVGLPDLPPGGWRPLVDYWFPTNGDRTTSDFRLGQKKLEELQKKWEGLERDTLELVKAQRYLELRWGELLGPRRQGEGGGRGKKLSTAVESISRDERRWFRLLAAARDDVLDALETADSIEALARRPLLVLARAAVRRYRPSRKKGQPLRLRPTRGETRPAERAYSVAEWTALDPATRRQIIAAGFDCAEKLNEQPTDAIEWARRSLNTVTGCLHNCPYCYARDIAERIYPQGFAPTFYPSRLGAPAHEPLPPEAAGDRAYRHIFANSMSDLFGQWVPAEWIDATIEMARRNSQWTFLVLTKFPQRAAEFEFPKNWWMGTTVDAQARVANAEKAFAKIRCGTKWLSVEPLLQALQFEQLDLFQWVVIGGASPSAQTPAYVPPLRPFAQLVTDASAAGLAVYCKTNLRLPETMRLREFPWGRRPTEPRVAESFRYLKGL